MKAGLTERICHRWRCSKDTVQRVSERTPIRFEIFKESWEGVAERVIGEGLKQEVATRYSVKPHISTTLRMTWPQEAEPHGCDSSHPHENGSKLQGLPTGSFSESRPDAAKQHKNPHCWRLERKLGGTSQLCLSLHPCVQNIKLQFW